MKMEQRQRTTTIQLRQSEGEQEVIEGYALKFDRWSDTLGWFYPFREKLAQGCLDDTDTSNVVALFNHDSSQVLGRTGANVELEVDNIGLKFRIKPTNTTLSRDLMENIRAGVINQCSFAFTVPNEEGAEEWEETEEGTYWVLCCSLRRERAPLWDRKIYAKSAAMGNGHTKSLRCRSSGRVGP